ncbi:hypothetical protein OS189_12415 [Sulfitobacter sp. F26169L]|uniref:hypothetical protein n=1 Tax=Sulfitobacter sp. F26169L TaxID=2996015 RepID=UPI0022608787|nr:hypothetical protein [Sulfitobacter sp. F26169L]MCX7567148.1 hypothetical protein [Sulfitobacter sp. F26169L]
MNKRTEEIKFKVSVAEKAELEQIWKEARYQTRASYVRDSALLGTPLELTKIALRIGQLSLLCNELLCDTDESTSGSRRLTGPAAKKAVKKIMEACDEVRDELREITSCVRT